jgi:3-dehydroquinate synthase
MFVDAELQRQARYVVPVAFQAEVCAALAYPVAFTRDVFDPDNDTLRWALTRREPERIHRCVAVLDGNLERALPDLRSRLERYAEASDGAMQLATTITIVGGEAAKNDRNIVDRLHDAFRIAKLDRQSHVIAIGGGAVLDVVGYAAATTHRGIRLTRLPTTVLAQNDAGIGVKNGINAFGVKNFLGTFAAPFAVLNDIDFLRTLSARDRIAGTAEAIKVSLIRDPEFFAWIEAHATDLREGTAGALEHLVRRCAELHLAHICQGGDPFELGSSRPLDFGHWAAHKLEVMSDHALRHGEAVAIGMAIDTVYAHQSGMLEASTRDRILRTIAACGLPLWHRCLDQAGENGRRVVLDGLDEFREHLGGDLTITLPIEIGRAVDVVTIETSRTDTAIEYLGAWSPGADAARSGS